MSQGALGVSDSADGDSDTIRYPSVAFKIQKGLASLQKENICTDFEVVVDGRSFQCHKAVLASVSDYFKAMFQSDMKETVQHKAMLDNVSSKAFETVIDIIYPKDNDINLLSSLTEDELRDLLRIADMLQMECVSSLCLERFKDTMTDNNCVGRWKTGKDILSDKLETMAWIYLLAHFDFAFKSSDMLTLDYKELLSIISDDALQLADEISVWKLISDWISFSKSSREDKIAALLKNCCLTEIDQIFLSENIAFDETVRSNNCASMLVQEAVKFHNHPGDHGNVELKLRPCMGKEQVYVFLGSLTEKGTLCMTRFSSNLTSGRYLKSPPMLNEFACCVHGRSIYVSGGTNGHGYTMFEYVEQQNKWIKCPGILPVPLARHAMVATDDSLYLVCGRSREACNERVLQYKLSSKQWHIHGEILDPVEHASAVCMHKQIYVFGGTSAEEPFLASRTVQLYDTQTKTSVILQYQLPTQCAYSCAIKRQDNVFVATCNGEVVRLSGQNLETTELIAQIPDFHERKQFALVMENDIISIYGGITVDENGIKEISKNITYINVKSGEITISNLTKPWLFYGAPLKMVLQSTLSDI